MKTPVTRSGPQEPIASTPDSPEPLRATVSIQQDLKSASINPDGGTALDGLQLMGIVDFRLGKVREYERLALFPPSYHPLKGESLRIYQQISPGMKWLGPTAYYVANPYVLIVAVCANHVTPLNLLCPAAGITYTYRRIDEAHRGEAAACWLDRVFDPPYADQPGEVRLAMVNAFDCGLRYAHVDRSQSSNLESEADPANVLNGLFSQSSFYHVGKYRANNISPEDRNGWIRLAKRNASTRIHVKLWRQQPASRAEPPDMVYEIRVDPRTASKPDALER